MEKEEKKKKKFIYPIIILVLLIIIGILLYFLLFANKITIHTDGGKVVTDIEIKDGEIVTLPVIEKEGYKVVAYINENNQIIRKGTKINKGSKITPVYVNDEAELVTITFYNGNEIFEKVELAKGSNLLLPVNPEKEGMIFGGWISENDMMLIGEPIVSENLILKAVWISNEKEMVTVTIISDNKELGKYKQEKGSKIKLPSPTKKEGMVFEEWQDEKGNTVTNETILEKDIIIHAFFAKYACPEDCIVNSNGKTCTKTTTADKVSKTTCPDGAFIYYGKCITMKGAVSANIRQCDGDMSGKETYYNNYCVKVVQKVTKKVCPDGFTENNGICQKATIINCTKEE